MRVSFIVEGDTEKIIIESAAFMAWAKASGIEICAPVINAKGGGNLLPQNMAQIVMQAKRANPDHIVILTDLEEFSIGDILSKERWYGVTYEVVDILHGTLTLRNMQDGYTFTWDGYHFEVGVQIRKAGGPTKTPIERKIAHLYKLFEERNKK